MGDLGWDPPEEPVELTDEELLDEGEYLYESRQAARERADELAGLNAEVDWESRV